MSDGIGLAEALLGLDGFRVLEVVETPDEVIVDDRDDREVVGCARCGARAEAQDRMPVDDPRSAVFRSAGAAGVGQAAVALPRRRLRREDVDRAFASMSTRRRC